MSIVERIEEIGAEIERRLPSDESVQVLTRLADYLPSVLVIHPSLGLICVEVGSSHEDSLTVRARLNSKVDDLQQVLKVDQRPPIWRVSVISKQESDLEVIGKSALTVRLDALVSADWPSHFKPTKISKSLISSLREKFNPAFSFKLMRWEGADDPNLARRREVQLLLDEEQSRIAARQIEDVMILSGPPGSGKTLVLYARARLLAIQHPDWRIVLVVYTKNLAYSLRVKAVDMPKSVEIITLKDFLEAQNVGRFAKHIFPKGDETDEEVEAKAEREYKAIKGFDFKPDVDAMMIDEWQDFSAPYLKYLFGVVRKKRGGILMAGDDHQAIFRDAPAEESLRTRKVQRVKLKNSYRSTTQILAVAHALDETRPKLAINHALSGEPVNLVRCSNWVGQADAIAYEIQTLLAKGRRPGDIAVLTATRSGARNYVSESLQRAGIPFVNMADYWSSPLRSNAAVSVMTVHSGKGDEFQVVLTHGFEIIKPASKSGASKKWENVAYVAVTRAQDLLFVMYSKFEGFVPQLDRLGEDVLTRRNYPDDYDV
jgi:hypothetical protein